MRKVLFFGDSITQGEGVEQTQRWTTLITALSQGAFSEINEGKGGRPTSAFDEFEAAVRKYKDDYAIFLLVIALGGNDARDTSQDCAAKAAANLGRMIVFTREHAAHWKILVAAPYNINRARLGPTFAIGPIREKNLVDMRHAFAETAASAACAFVDFHGILPADSLTADGVHPNAAGHEKIAAVAWPAIEECLRHASPG